MMQKKTFNQVAFTLAKMQFNEWAEELGNKVDAAMNTALNIDNRLCIKTKEKIFNSFVECIKEDDKFRGYV
jgi:uncharacterized Fe-S cluster protein YjdI